MRLMKLRWALNRIRAMGVRELRYRGRKALRARLERAGLGRVPQLAADGRRGRPWITAWPEGLDAQPYREAAERILRGEFTLFGRDFALGFPPDWNVDPATARRAPLAFGKTLNYRDAALVGNIKYLWEPNRHLELVTLAQAWRLTGEARFAQGVRTLLDSWIAQCPYMQGPNWASSLELGLRLVNWSCAWHLLGGDQAVVFQGADADDFKARWLGAVRQHCHFIAGHLSYHSSANNHLLGELLGLLIGATTWPCWPESAGWRARALREFEEQALLQNAADGVNREQAIWYQHEVADMMLLAGLTARQNGCDFGGAFWDRLEAMFDFIASCMDVGGNVPAFGDADDAVIVRFDPHRALHPYHSLLACGSVLFARGDFKHKAQLFDDKARWLLGDGAAARFAAIAVDDSGRRLRRSFAEGGYYILGSDFETAARGTPDLRCRTSWLSCDRGARSRGCPVFRVVSFRATAVDRSGNLLLPHRATLARLLPRHRRTQHPARRSPGSVHLRRPLSLEPPRCRPLSGIRPRQHRDPQRVVAEHDGYRRLADPVMHRREVSFEPAARVVKVTDRLACTGSHFIEIFWHFAAECEVRLTNDAVLVTRDGISLVLRWPVPLQARLLRGSLEPAAGWSRRSSMRRSPPYTLIVSGDIAGTWQGETTLEISP